MSSHTVERPLDNQTVTLESTPVTPGNRSTSRWIAPLLEIVVAFVALAIFLAWSGTIDVDPLDRLGQVSGLAGLQFRFVLLGLVLIAVVLLAARIRQGAGVALAGRLATAAISGLAGGLVAGGVLVALRGTSWALHANHGDSGVLIRWAEGLLRGESMPSNYPPLSVYALAGWTWLTGEPAGFALQDVQIIGVALFAPLAYLAWRLVLRPGWALGIGVVSTLPLIDPHKPYANLALVVFIPVLVRFLQTVRRADQASYRKLLLGGAAFGVGFGLLFLLYSGWYVWSAPGAVLALLLVFPWKAAPRKGVALVAVTTAVFALVSIRHLYGLLRGAGSTKDQYFYFDVFTDPAYFSMWRTDLPGPVGVWPPLGELGGVGLFTIVLVIGLAVALGLGLRRTVVIAVVACLAGTWLLRFYFASRMYAENAVQLYPRTVAEILYCLLVLTGYAVFLAVERFGVPRPRFALSGKVGLPARIGLLAAMLLLLGSAGSAIADRHMPRNDDSVGFLAWVAQVNRMPDGRCSPYVPADACVTQYDKLREVKVPPRKR
ncbi:hypothetical protein [Crossiella cryophila]|uniref:Galactan 5-O-arabinofuranosyltransferase n=1 Tax=Crossiella cryophila TaxID=43355 RepID=A0A7W7FU29_9PSEU|nr:hypothetical protein [Crossiella cryophila]MBB4675384.1 galactan 5-O-arabinofuranosyltransferase [Crossiella cryophila]